MSSYLSSSSSGSSSSGMADSSTALSSDDSGVSASPEGIVLFLSVCLLIGCVCRWLVKRFDRLPLPFTVLLLFVGVIMGALVGYDHKADNAFQAAILTFSNLPPHLALYLFLPVLIFDSAFNVHFHLFMHSLWASLLLAFPGAVFALLSAALVVYYCFDWGWSWNESLLLGSVLAATDPVAVVSLMRDLGANYALSALVEAESLLNDGSAYVVYLVVQSTLLDGTTDAGSVVGSLFQYSLGGPAFGVLIGLVTVVVMDTFIYHDAEIEIALTIAVVYVTFYVADSVLNVSAVLALVCLGLVMSKNRYSISPSVQPSLQAVWSCLVFIANILIFVLIGLIIADKLFFTQGVGWQDVGCVLLLYVVLHIVRFLTIVAFLPLFRRSSMQLSWNEVLMVSWSGVRGGMSLLLAIITYLQPAYNSSFRSRLTFLVSGVALLTLVINCVSARYVLKWLRLDRGTDESSLMLQSALLHMREQTEEVMDKLANKVRFKRVDWVAIESFLPKRLIDEVLEETGQPPLPHSPPPNSPQPSDQSELTNRTSSTPAADVLVDMPSSHHVSYFSKPASERQSYSTLLRGGVKEEKEMEHITQYDYRVEHAQLRAEAEDDEESDVDSTDSEDEEDERERVEQQQRAHALSPQTDAAPRSIIRSVSNSVLRQHIAAPAVVPDGDRHIEVANVALAADRAELQSLEQPTSPSLLTTAASIMRSSPLDPPPAPSAPVVPHPPPFLTVPASHLWESNLPFRLPRTRRSRRGWRPHADSHNLSSAPLVPQSRMQRELSVRYLTAMQADYARQFSSGLITRPALRVLNAACEHGVSKASVRSCWSMLQRQIACPSWLAYCYSSSDLLSDEWYIRPFVPLVHHLLFRHLKLSVELTTAFLSASRRLEAVLEEFPEVSLIDTSAVSAVQQQVAALQQRALEQWVDISEAYSEAHSAVVTRHAAIMLLHFQQREIRSLHSTGMLEQREFDLIVALINAKLVRLDQRGLQMHMSTAVELLQQHPALQTLTEEQKRRLRQWMRAKRTRRWHQAHHTVWGKGQHCPGLILTVRGTMRVTYDYDGSGGGGGGGSNEQDGDGRDSHSHNYKHGMGLSKDEHKDGHGYGSGYGRGLGYGRDEEAETSNRGVYRQQQQQYASPQPPARSWSAALAHLLGRTSSSSDVLSPPHHSSPQQQQHDHSQPAPQSSTPHRYVDTKGRLSVVGAYEMLTGHSTLASCRTVTMAESFLLDGECVDVLMDEDEAMQSMVRWAADDIMKARWTHWALHTQTSLKHYHIPYLLDRAHVFRSKAPAQPQQRREAQTQQTAAAAAGMGRDDGSGVGHDGTEADKHDGRAERDEGKAGGDDRHGRSDSASAGGNADDSDEHKLQPRSQSPSQSQSQSQSLSLSHPQPQPQSQPSSGSPRRPSPSQHRISLRYNDVLLIIDGSAVGDGMTRRVKRSAAQQQQQSVLQPRPARQQKQPPSLPRAATSTAGVTTGLPASPPGRPLPPPSTRRPLYLGPCMLRHRQGQLLMSAHCLYCRWELRDEEIASLFPPPPRADMRQYARELGLRTSKQAASPTEPTADLQLQLNVTQPTAQQYTPRRHRPELKEHKEEEEEEEEVAVEVEEAEAEQAEREEDDYFPASSVVSAQSPRAARLLPLEVDSININMMTI